MLQLSEFKSSFKVLREHWGFFTLFLVASLVVAISEGLGITTLVPLLDGVSGGLEALKSFPLGEHLVKFFSTISLEERMKIIAMLIAAFGVLRGISTFVTTHVASLLELKVYIKTRSNAFKRLFTLDMQTFYDYEGGKLISFVESLSEKMSSTVQAYLQVLGAMILMGFHICLLLLISWKLTLASGAMLLGVHYIVRKKLVKKLEKLSAEVLNIRINLNTLTAEVIQGMKFIHLTAQENKLANKNKDMSSDYIQKFKVQQKYYDLIVPTFSTIIALVIAGLIIGGVYFIQGELGTKLVSILLFLIIVTRLSAPAQTLLQNQSTIVKNICAFDEYNRFFEKAEKEKQIALPNEFKKLEKEIVFNNVSFRYKSNPNVILQNISFSLPAHKTTALVGPSGSGKTTIANLIGKLYSPAEGEITIDRVMLSSIKDSTWLSKVGFVSQDVFLFNDTVKNNLLFPCRNKVSDNQILYAAKMAHAHEFIMSLKDGYETIIGDKGVKLSGGQQQRLSIARAILMEPELLVLDEATSHLDSLTEQAIQEAIEFFRTRCTILIIAHRLATVKSADQILVLEKGKLVQSGIHSFLISQPGLYQQMTELQFMETSE